MALGLLIRSVPYEQRSAREQLDVALAAAALDIPLRLYFQGSAVFQLLVDRDATLAQLPPGYRGWGSLPELTSVSAHAEPEWLLKLSGAGLDTVLPLTALSATEMRFDFSSCEKVLLL